MAKIIAMIPARLGSKRVPKKNLRLINGKPLITYVIETAKDAGVFDAIYINSEADVFGDMAKEWDVSFYRRPADLACDTATNDEFALDFMANVDGDVLIQVLPTSPLLTVSDLRNFTRTMIEEDFDSLISVEAKQIACVYKDQPINFDKYKVNPPSQTMSPVQAYATALMGWTYPSFQRNMQKYGSAYHGGDGKVGYYELRGLSTVDIDREEDFLLAEALLKIQLDESNSPVEYYGNTGQHAEVDVKSILTRDGVVHNDLDDANKEVVHVPTVIQSATPDQSWSKRIINTESNSVTLIAQLPGEGNRRHYHPNWDEWWYILEGKWEWEIEGEQRVVRQGDVVFMRRGRPHKITAVGDELAIRMAVSRADVAHVYRED